MIDCMSACFELEPYEELIAVTGCSSTALFWPTVRLAGIAVAAGYIGARLEVWLAADPTLVAATRAALLLVAGWLLVRLVSRPFRSWSGQLCAVTSHRILIKYSLKKPPVWSIPYGMITDVRCHRRSGQFITNTATVTIQTTFSAHPACLRRIRRPQLLLQDVGAAASQTGIPSAPSSRYHAQRQGR